LAPFKIKIANLCKTHASQDISSPKATVGVCVLALPTLDALVSDRAWKAAEPREGLRKEGDAKTRYEILCALARPNVCAWAR
jgi:hypothetical protein